MHIYSLKDGRDATSLPKGAVIVLGHFDGVHLGHRALIREAIEISNGSPVAVWSPIGLYGSELLTTPEEKAEIFATLGADYMIYEDFDSIKGMDGEAFFSDYLYGKLTPSAVVSGYNFRFGRGASCGVEELSDFAIEHGILCRTVPEFRLCNRPVSSTEIRRLIKEGAVDEAAMLLGAPYSITSPVIHGAALGRRMGVRTINQSIPQVKVRPLMGVYATSVLVDGREYPAVTNIGKKPTVQKDGEITAESHIFDFSGDIYGLSATVKLKKFLRPERKFDSVEELREQIEADMESARSLSQNTLY